MLNLLQNIAVDQQNVTPIDANTTKVANTGTKLDQLSNKLADTTGKIAELTAMKREIEEEILQIVGVEEEGATSISTDLFKVTTTGKLTRKVSDVSQLQSIAPEVLRTKYELDTKKFKALAVSNPKLYQQVQAFIESKSAKASIKVESLES